MIKFVCTQNHKGESNMDKQNYTLRNIKKQAIQKHFYKIKKKLKKKLSSFDLIKRKRIINIILLCQIQPGENKY